MLEIRILNEQQRQFCSMFQLEGSIVYESAAGDRVSQQGDMPNGIQRHNMEIMQLV